MRPDLAKCTTERERIGSSCPSIKYGGRVRIHPDPDHDYLDEHGGIHPSSRHRNIDSKNLTDVLNPLIGNLRKALGRPWNDVYSEFCQVLDRRSMAGYHIWTHLMQEVTVNTLLRSGKVFHYGRFGSGFHEVDGYYVHPITGILEYRSRPRYRFGGLTPRPDTQVRIDVPGSPGWQYQKLNGLWFRTRHRTIADYEAGLCSIEYISTLWKRSCNRKEVLWIQRQLAKPGV